MTPRLIRMIISIITGLSLAAALGGSAQADTTVHAAMPAYSGGLCTPYAVPYCSHGYAQAMANQAAWHWSDTHKTIYERRPVPYPSILSWNTYRYYHVIYVVKYRYRDNRPEVWKYGITRQVPYTLRANVGRRDCEAFFRGVGGYTCWVDWVAVSNRSHGWYWARYMEASLIMAWHRSHPGQRCPRGQEYSCR